MDALFLAPAVTLSAMFLLFFLLNLPSYASEAAWVWPTAYAKHRGVAAEEIFLLQAHFPRAKEKIVERGPGPFPWQKRLHLVFRLERSPEPKILAQKFLQLAKRWQEQGANVLGLQLDYDSPTAKLGEYAKILIEVRALLPKSYALSVTGLADWLQSDAQLVQDVQIFFQLYQGKKQHQEMERYLAQLSALKTPFRIGLLPDQTIDQTWHKKISQNTHFHGIVRFYGE